MFVSIPLYYLPGEREPSCPERKLLRASSRVELVRLIREHAEAYFRATWEEVMGAFPESDLVFEDRTQPVNGYVPNWFGDYGAWMRGEYVSSVVWYPVIEEE